jgi:hypothetical protein
VQPPRLVLPRDISLEYRDHLKNLVRTYEKDESGNYKMVYVATGADHYAHSLAYAEMALPMAASITSGENINKFL